MATRADRRGGFLRRALHRMVQPAEEIEDDELRSDSDPLHDPEPRGHGPCPQGRDL